jgi:hypothetical protein
MTDKQNVVHSHSGILFSLEKKGASDILSGVVSTEDITPAEINCSQSKCCGIPLAGGPTVATFKDESGKRAARGWGRTRGAGV